MEYSTAILMSSSGHQIIRCADLACPSTCRELYWVTSLVPRPIDDLGTRLLGYCTGLIPRLEVYIHNE